MRISTWNMAYWSHRKTHDEAWRWMLETHNPDILLCQECAPPAWVKNDWSVFWEPAYPDSKQRWGTGIVTRLPARAARIEELDDWFAAVPSKLPGKDELAGIHRSDGWVATGEVTPRGKAPILVTSVHSPAYPIEKSRLSGMDVTGMKLELNPDLWLLDVLFFFLKRRIGRGFVVGGDFNYSRLLDEPRATGNAEFFDRVASEGFVSLHRRLHDGDQQTFFQKGRGPHQLDYLYADELGAEGLRRCDVVPYGEVIRFSDHAPLFAELAD